MMQYHFHDLFESIEFEQLARDVVQIRDRIVLETFAKGPDSGMDGRFVSTNKTVILQVKNYEANNFASLLKSLKQEREKLERIRIDRYILVLSVNLTPKRKAEIQDLFQPYITIPSDIITEDDLNNLLGQAEYKCVMEKYNQLWLGNREALRTMLSETVNGILLEESEEEYQASLLYSGTFVRTKVFEKVLSILSRRNVLVISGEPGVGKTALARQLGIFYTQFREYDKFIWVHSVDDLYRAQRLDGKKVVVFDDFWGSNFYRYFSHDSEEKRLAVLIERIAYRGDFTLILTTREYVLAQGLEKNPEFRDIVRRLKLECRIQEYSIAEKAQIFFRLLKKSDLNWSQTEILFSNSKEIVDHAKYNPRVIDMFLKTVDIEEPPDECEARFFDYLESPTTFWESIFTALSKDAQIMFLLFSLSNLPIGEEYAKKTYASYLGFLSNASEHKSYNAVVIELEKTVIETFYIENENLRIIKFQNPSAIDFIHTFLRERIANYLYILMDCCYYYEQLINLLWISEHVLSYEQQITLLRECIDKLETQPGRKSDEYYEFLSDSELEYYEPSSFTQTDLAKYRLLLSIYVGLDIAEFSDFF